MIVAESLAELRVEMKALRRRHRRIAFVPTMGNLHPGHLRLMHEARNHADAVVASIFVNPLQFGEGEDLEAYPRTPTEDRAALEEEGVELLFLPPVEAVYPRGLAAQTRVEVPGLSDILCGAARPGHFRGVTTVVARLLNLVAPQVAVFGKKDYQQWLIIRLMAADLGLPVEIVGVETVREPDGLAMSSRNRYLAPEERAVAPKLYRTLRDLRERLLQGAPVSGELEAEAMEQLARAGFRPEYVSVRRQRDLGEASAADRELVILAAAWLGRARLIDNIELNLNGPG